MSDRPRLPGVPVDMRDVRARQQAAFDAMFDEYLRRSGERNNAYADTLKGREEIQPQLPQVGKPEIEFQIAEKQPQSPDVCDDPASESSANSARDPEARSKPTPR